VPGFRLAALDLRGLAVDFRYLDDSRGAEKRVSELDSQSAYGKRAVYVKCRIYLVWTIFVGCGK
jgi:hypothetical protein